jgi:CRISPR/Cas system-associated endonuclease Cas1
MLSPVAASSYRLLASARNVAQVRNIEAQHATRYWTAYFSRVLGEDASDVTRRADREHPVTSALDACSFFLTGIILRWVLFHKLSPFHGYLHQTTGYPSLVYDLIEPYRCWIGDAVEIAVTKVGAANGQQLTAASVTALKSILEESVYVPATRQTVRRKSLLHGAVLSLRAWLLRKQARLVLPVEGPKTGGRPPKLGFKIPGYSTPPTYQRPELTVAQSVE